MFFSIPKEFFVPVIFDKGFVLNTENNNMELDTDNYRENTVTKNNVETNLKKEVIENENYNMGKETKDCNIINLDIVKEIDDEYISGEMNIDKKC